MILIDSRRVVGCVGFSAEIVRGVKSWKAGDVDRISDVSFPLCPTTAVQGHGRSIVDPKPTVITVEFVG